jgi:hypothetical protein
MQRILIFSNFSENYSLLNLIVFEKLEYIFYIGYISFKSGPLCMHEFMDIAFPTVLIFFYFHYYD